MHKEENKQPYECTPSTPVGYADDLAACCRVQADLNIVMNVVENHGRAWRYDFNAKNSGVLVYGETRNEHNRNSINCNQAGYSGARVRLNISVHCLGFASQYRALWLPSATN